MKQTSKSANSLDEIGRILDNQITELRIRVPLSMKREDAQALLKKYFPECSLETKEDLENHKSYFIIGKRNLIGDIQKILSIAEKQYIPMIDAITAINHCTDCTKKDECLGCPEGF